MRGGVLLCEETPADLMSKNDCDSMESAFLKLSYIQESSKSVSKLKKEISVCNSLFLLLIESESFLHISLHL